MLYAASFIDSALVLAVNSAPQHSVGSLTSANASDLEEKLGRFYKGDFSVLSRTRLNVEINSKHAGLALNDVYIGSIKPFGIAARYAIKVDGKEEEQKSSGIIVSTGTGSTAMFKHFGKAFKAYACYAKYAVSFPIGKYELISGKVKEITVISGMTKNDLLTIDGWTDFNYGHKSVIRVSIADKPLRTIEFG
ncbi:NAD(+)/NADH kinase [Candidatus Woesearchaeota archaeon]|nr:NAD(+)/NADH kinase [Candidatus Woesearchaeota archaeon]